MTFIMILWYRNGVKNNNLLYTDTDIPLIKTDDFYQDTANEVEKWFDTSRYDERSKKCHYLWQKTKT